MRIIIITQDEPFYLGKNINYLLNILPKEHQVVGAVIANPSPFGKKESFVKKARKTLSIFGIKFFIFYSIKYIMNYFDTEKNVQSIFSKHGIPKIKLTKSINHQSSIKAIEMYSPDLLVSIQGNEIFKKSIIKLAKKGCINLHTALLPKYRGLMPTFWALKNNEKYTGVSVFFVDEGIDSGPIIFQKRIEIKNQTQEELIIQTKKIGMEAIVEAIKLINEDNITLIENDDSKKTYFSFPNKSDVNDFKKIGKSFF
jgi:methionyl-tRNA formyltransferase|tara:strand:+ start:1146 stop:1910 length:765 start_codon:yes stop_codon:yes gene_type:complete